MARFPLNLVGCLPNVDSFCGSTTEYGADFTVFMYYFLALICCFVPLKTFEYHHLAKPLILIYLQWVFLYPGVLCSVVVAVMTALVAACVRRRVFYMRFKIRDNPLSPYVLLLCLFMSTCFIVWGVLAFIRAFIDPGLHKFDDRKTNPYGKHVCEKLPRGAKICRGPSEEEQRKAKQWKIDHANDTVHKYGNKTFDSIVSLMFILVHLCGFYPLLALKALLSEAEDDDDED